MAAKIINTSPIKPRAYRVADFCAAFGIKRSKAYQLIASGELPSIRIGRCRLIPVDQAERLLEGSE
ncbi:MAG TPA: helix-turn-helix domain-containing protein [Caulobacteraceae bacterium]|jgi:excisionase family DNA binding protein|nr:helix-turn-helix domain-containing protein [Caulobacteraceae bacterium]